MSMRKSNLLLVEGKDEEYTIPFFMDHYVEWGNRKDQRVVEIKSFNGVENLLKPGAIELESRASGLKALGIILDANDSFDSRWANVKKEVMLIDSEFPETLPANGLVYQVAEGLRIGVWIMPDNQSRGMLETFLGFLLKPDHHPIWELAQETCNKASHLPGSYSPAHKDKSLIHTYLALVEPPGLGLPYSLLQKILSPRLPLGQRFADWMIELFQLTRR